MRKPIIEKGDKFNKLTAIKFCYKDNNSRQYWLFKCECGNEKIIRADRVKLGNTKSCGCIKRTHNITNEKRTYISWRAMKQRCLNKNYTKYKNYGGRGITICKEWLDFENFFRDIGSRPLGLTLDRIDNEKGYFKENCRWATTKEQQNNKRNNKR